MTNFSEATNFQICIDSQTINVCYRPKMFADHGHIEFTSPDKGKRIPVSETGYLSHFSPMWETEEAPSIEEYVEELAKALLRRTAEPDYAHDADEQEEQLELF